jgi:hypothetical protein
MLKFVTSLLVCACVLASPVLAGGGGGGAKRDALIRIVHNLPAGSLTALPPLGPGAGNDSVIVIVDPPAALIAKVNGGTAVPKDIVAAGGVIIKVGRSATLPAKSGNARLLAAYVRPGGFVSPLTADNIPTVKGQTVTVNASDATVIFPGLWPL